MIRCITPNLQEDFILLNRKKHLIRSFANYDNLTDKMNVKKLKKINIKDTALIDGELHTVVGSPNEDFLLIFSKHDIFKLKMEDGTVTV